jgi:hypothetical protein
MIDNQVIERPRNPLSKKNIDVYERLYMFIRIDKQEDLDCLINSYQCWMFIIVDQQGGPDSLINSYLAGFLATFLLIGALSI